MNRFKTVALVAILCSTLGACTNPYDPGQRAVAGGAIGAGTGRRRPRGFGWRAYRRRRGRGRRCRDDASTPTSRL